MGVSPAKEMGAARMEVIKMEKEDKTGGGGQGEGNCRYGTEAKWEMK